MQASVVAEKVTSTLPGAEVQVQGEDCSFTLVVISDTFAGLTPVKRQQTVLGCFSEELASGELHALSVQSYTPAEWQGRQNQGLTQIG